MEERALHEGLYLQGTREGPHTDEMLLHIFWGGGRSRWIVWGKRGGRFSPIEVKGDIYGGLDLIWEERTSLFFLGERKKKELLTREKNPRS